MQKQFRKAARLSRRFYATPFGLYILCVLILTAYLTVIQHAFVFSGDTWAEAFPEYVNEAITLGWNNVIMPSWAGYLTIIPSFLSMLYPSVGLPLGYIDVYLRAVSLIFAVLCISFIAHPINRKLITQDWLRILIAMLLLFAVQHISSLAFINIWYAGFVVVALVSLSKLRLRKRWDIAYTIFALLVVLSKSSLVLLPFVVYRGIRTKQYVQNGLITVAILYQTYLTIFAKNGYGDSGLNVSILGIIRDLFLSISVLSLKIFHLTLASPWLLLILSLLLVLGLAYAWILQKRLTALAVVVAGLALSIYLHIFAPDNAIGNLWFNYSQLAGNYYKVQREFFIFFLLLILMGVAVSPLISKIRRGTWQMYSVYAACAVLVLVSMPFKSIDVRSPGVHTSISAYRVSLNEKASICMPVAPTPAWDYHALWFFQYRGGCYMKQTAQPIDYNNSLKPITSTGFPIEIAGSSKDDLKTVFLPVSGPTQTRYAVILEDTKTRHTYSAVVPSDQEKIHFISFNVNGLGPRPDGYAFTLRTADPRQKLQLLHFKKSKIPVIYNYYMGYPNFQ